MNEDAQFPATRHWAMDKRIPIALIFALGMQTFGLIVWGARLDARVGALESDKAGASIASTTTQSILNEQGQRIVRLETQFSSIDQRLTTIDNKIDRLVERGNP